MWKAASPTLLLFSLPLTLTLPLPSGLRWSERSSYCQNIPNVNDQPQYDPRQQYINFQCVMPLSLVYCVFVALWGGYLLLAIYIDNILPNEYGVSRCAWFG